MINLQLLSEFCQFSHFNDKSQAKMRNSIMFISVCLSEIVKADTHEGFCSRSMLQAHFARVSTHEGAFSSSLNLPREFAPKYLTG